MEENHEKYSRNLMKINDPINIYMEIKSGDYIIHTCFFFYYSNIIDDFYIILRLLIKKYIFMGNH